MRNQTTRHLRLMSSAFRGEAFVQLALGVLSLFTRYRRWSIVLFALAATCAFIREFYLEELRRRKGGGADSSGLEYWRGDDDDEYDDDDDVF